MKYKKSQLISIEVKQTATQMGYDAFKRGVKCIPNNDMNNIKTLADGTFETIDQVMTAWIKGWTKGNLEA